MIANEENTSGVIRLILFSSYLTKCVVLARVEAEEEKYAFDIFDALNTTGQPLTALETLRPKIMQHEKARFYGSDSDTYLKNIKTHLDDIYPDTDKRQKATKDLLVSFALYFEGHKLSLNLNSQRTYLRSTFDNIRTDEHKTHFIRSISELAEFRHYYWNAGEIKKLSTQHPSLVNEDLTQLCFMFIHNMKTSLAVPILARYWVKFKADSNESTFFDAVKALTAFIVLRRAVTGNTGGIDTELRRVMGKLCVGKEQSAELINVKDYKDELLHSLSSSGRVRFRFTGKDEWIDKVSKVALGDYPPPLCRFLLLAAAHHAKPQQDNPGLLCREEVRPSNEQNFLDFKTWKSQDCETIEHIAPVSASAGNWDDKIYRDQDTRHKIGNLILLPKIENSSIGNSSWSKKKILYTALASSTKKEVKQILLQAKREGYSISEDMYDRILEGKRYHLLDPLIQVHNWDINLIERRTTNILELAWDQISPWLYGQ